MPSEETIRQSGFFVLWMKNKAGGFDKIFGANLWCRLLFEN
jgi:hypothetical protein